MRRSFLAAALLALALIAPSALIRAEPLMPALEKLAAANNAEAIYHLGMAWQTGTGLAKDPGKALAAFRRAASLGDPLAAYKLGCFYDGQGEGLVDRDPAAALQHKLIAAEAGYALAQQDVAALYARKGDMASGLGWLGKAAAQGWPGALMAYASVHNGAPGVPRDSAKTAAYFRLFLDRAEGSAAQKQWLSDFEVKLTPAQRTQAAAIVRAYRPAPTPLTLKSLLGQRAALALVAAR